MNTTAGDHSERYRRIFYPYAAEATARAQEGGGRFVYYTSAATGLKVLRNREVWMRSAATMNDYLEVEHGLQSLLKAYRSHAGKALDAALNECFPDVSVEIHDLFHQWIPLIQTDTFVACLSEHEAAEDAHGRLSMWRAYGGMSGVALVINGGPLFRESHALAAYTSPVAYIDSDGVADQLRVIAQQVRANSDFVKGLGRKEVKNTMLDALRMASICTKHPAFREEREWRVIASPLLEASDLLPQSVEDIGGHPQTVLKIRLEDHPDRGLHGLAPSALLDRVLIGPSEYPDIVARAFRETLAQVGVPDAKYKVHVTGVPLRSWHG